jgi:hypothetical protein
VLRVVAVCLFFLVEGVYIQQGARGPQSTTPDGCCLLFVCFLWPPYRRTPAEGGNQLVLSKTAAKKRRCGQASCRSAGAGGPGWCSPGSWPHRGRPRRMALYISLSGIGQTLWQFGLRNRKLQTVSQIVTKVQLCGTYKEYIPEVTENSHDYNMST